MTARKGDAGKADDLFRKIIHSRGRCEKCGSTRGPFDCAHIIPRDRSAVRCEETNAWCLCRVGCHPTVDQWPEEKLALVERTIGMDVYLANRKRAEEFTSGMRPSSKVFWRGEVERLTARCEELGLDTRRRAA